MLHIKKSSKGEEESLTPDKEYEFCINRVGIKPKDYWDLTPAETYSIVQGWLWRKERRSADFRELYTLQFNQWSKSKKLSSQLWPLRLLDKRFTMFDSAEDEYKWRGKMLDWGEKFFKN